MDKSGDASGVTTTAAADAVAPTAHAPGTSRRLGGRFRLAVVAIAVAVVVAPSTWVGYVITNSGSDDPRVAAAVTGAVERDRWSGRAALTILVSNAGPGSVRIRGYAGHDSRDADMTMQPPGPTIAAGSTVDLTADVGLRCDQAQHFKVPDLLVETGSGAQRPVTPVGAVGTLTAYCATSETAVKPLRVASSTTEGNQLLLTISSPSGRPATIHEVAAYGVPLVAQPLPAQVGRAAKSSPVAMTRLRLAPPPQCPISWQETGIPAELLVKISSGGPATVTLHVGPPLIRWALDHVCPVR